MNDLRIAHDAAPGGADLSRLPVTGRPPEPAVRQPPTPSPSTIVRFEGWSDADKWPARNPDASQLGIDQPIACSPRVTVALWTLVWLLTATVAVVLVASRQGWGQGLLWQLATLGGHPHALADLGAACTNFLIGLACVTRGFTRADRRQAVALRVGGGIGVLVVAGAVLVALAAELVTAVLIVLAAGFLYLVTES